MTCEELRPDYTAWALGVLEDPEHAEICEHLARHCATCRPGIAGALAVVSALSNTVKAAEPRASLRRRITAMVKTEELPQPEQKRSWAALLIPWAVAAALAVALVAVSLPGWNSARQNSSTAKLEQALSILNDPATKDVSFGEAQAPSKGRVFVSATRGVVFIAASLPRLEAGKTFQMWVIPAGGKPVSAGTFQSETDSSAVYVWPGPVEKGAAAVAVTVEPAGGSPQPTSTPFIVAGLS